MKSPFTTLKITGFHEIKNSLSIGSATQKDDYLTSSPFLKKNFFTKLSAHEGKILFIHTVLFPLKVSTTVRFLFSIATKMCWAHSAELIIASSFIRPSPSTSPSLPKATLRIHHYPVVRFL